MIQRGTLIKAFGAVAIVVAAGGATAGAGSPSARAQRLTVPKVAHPPFATAIADAGLPWAANPERGYDRVRATGANSFRFFLSWADVAPTGSKPPAGFNPADPLDRHYRWDFIDRNIRMIVRHGLRPIVCIQTAPLWAEDRRVEGAPGTRQPDPDAFALFAKALAKRYSGKLPGLPRVRYWQIWNEPNLPHFLSPQFVNGKPVSPSWYRQMLNRSAASIRSVRRDAVVIGGSLGPWGDAASNAVPPFAFMRALLCMSKARTPKTRCHSRTSFDIWAHHPYSRGGPDHRIGGDNASVVDLPAMRRLLMAAVRAGHVNSEGRQPGFWVTEFGWDSNPPDPAGVPEPLLERWVAEALYRMWSAGVSLVTWYPLRDNPLGVSVYQTGLYFFDGDQYRLNKPKPSLTAFRFPFVAYRSRGRVLVWGRAPAPSNHRAVVEQIDASGAWRQLAVLRCDASGIFTARLSAAPSGNLRARAGSDESVPFSLERPPDLTLASPFGT